MHIKYTLLVIFLILCCTYTASAQSVQSVYTDLNGKTCRTLERNDAEAGYLLTQCPGVGGYKLQVVSGDDRQTITIVKPDGSKHELNLTQVGGGGFSYVGPRAEWRVRRENGKVIPIALIVRFDVSTNPSDSSKTTSFLTVTKITPRKICLVEAVTPKPDANEAARIAADGSAGKACYEETSSGN
ncbi:MAG TPA: hypothetical protein VGO69_07575 [Pyrinomonadaceae bacterium]|nr:hypothetical protein [Pyrinomonadaceae bacterium]